MLEITDDLEDFICPDETNSELFFEENDDADIGLFGIPASIMRNEQNVDSSMNCGKKLDGPRGNPCRPNRYDGTRRTSGQKSSLNNQDMGSKEARLVSFDHVRHLIENDRLLNQIVESGLYFEGINESGIKVRCYSCGCALCDINNADDILSVHAQMTNCEHVINRKGWDFLLQAQVMDTSLDKSAVPLSGGSSKKPCTQRPVAIDEHHAQQSCFQRSGRRKESDTKKKHVQLSMLPEENNVKAHVQVIQQSEPNEERDAMKPCTHQSMSSSHQDVKNPLRLIKKLCTQQSMPSKDLACKIAPGCKRRQ